MKKLLDCLKSKKNHEQDHLLGKDRSSPVKGPFKKCLLIGINYVGTPNQLNGCINDSVNMRDFLIKNKYMKGKDITMMNDSCGMDLYPTKANMIKQFNLLVEFANQHKDKDIVHLFVAYSGHGSYTKDYSGDEADFRDEVLCCLNNEYIKDDFIKKNFIDKLGKNVKLVFVCDACYSQSVNDLKFTYKNGTMVDNPDISTESKCEAVMISGCRDNETSADAYIQNPTTHKWEFMGAMSGGFLNTYTDGISYKYLIEGMRTWVKNGNYTQIPQLTTDGYIDANSTFLLGIYDD